MAEETKEQGFTQERLDDVSAGKLQLSDLNPTEVGQLREYKQTGKIETGEIDAEPVLTPTIPEKTVEPNALEIENKSIKKKLFDQSVEINRQNQLASKQASDKAFIQKQLDDIKNQKVTPRTDDHFDDDSQKNFIERLSFLENQSVERLQRDQTQVNQAHVATVEIEQRNKAVSESLAIQQLQNNFPELKTSVSITQLDDELTSFSKSIGGLEEVNKYLENPEFKKAKDAEGLTPLSDVFMNNLDKFTKVVDLSHGYNVNKDDNGQSYSDRNPDVSIDNYYNNELQNSGKFSDMMANAKLAGATAVIDKVASQKYTATTMTPSSGADLPNDGMTAQRAIEIMKRVKGKVQMGQKLTPEETIERDEMRSFLRESSYGK